MKPWLFYQIGAACSLNMNETLIDDVVINDHTPWFSTLWICTSLFYQFVKLYTQPILLHSSYADSSWFEFLILIFECDLVFLLHNHLLNYVRHFWVKFHIFTDFISILDSWICYARASAGHFQSFNCEFYSDQLTIWNLGFFSWKCPY